MPQNEITITIVAHGTIASGKTRAINTMIEALHNFDFVTTAELPLRATAFGVEVYTFKAVLR